MARTTDRFLKEGAVDRLCSATGGDLGQRGTVPRKLQVAYIPQYFATEKLEIIMPLASLQ